MTGLARYRKIQANGGWPTVGAGSEMRLGGKGPQVAALRKRLAIEDADLSPTGDTFDQAMLDAVRRAQRRYGLNPAGQVGAQTVASLNVPVGERIKQIKANMERWRWLPTELEKNRIQVNIAAAVLTVFDGDQPVTSMKAVTGRPGDETPMLTSTIHSIVLNPPWNVPSSIADKELWPKERANPGYLKRNGFRVIETEGGGRRLQQASENSALGRFKFDFDNPFAVYLHDTRRRRLCEVRPAGQPWLRPSGKARGSCAAVAAHDARMAGYADRRDAGIGQNGAGQGRRSGKGLSAVLDRVRDTERHDELPRGSV